MGQIVRRGVGMLLLALALAVEALAAQPFSIVVLPDTQFYNKLPSPNLMGVQTQWIVDNKAADNIVFVTHLGDITDEGANPAYWVNAQAGMSTLDGQIPYSVCFGNHDVRVKDKVNGADACRSNFGDAAHQGQATYGGKSPDGMSFFQTISVPPFKLLHLNLTWDPNLATLTWAQSVIAQNPGEPTIVSTHAYLKPDGTRDVMGNRIWTNLVQSNPQIFLVMNGHYHGEAQLISTNAAGGSVAQFVSDYQSDLNGGNGWLRRLIFQPDAGQIGVETYSPSLKRFSTGPKSQFTYAAKFDPSANTIIITGLVPSLATTQPTSRPTTMAVPAGVLGSVHAGN